MKNKIRAFALQDDCGILLETIRFNKSDVFWAEEKWFKNVYGKDLYGHFNHNFRKIIPITITINSKKQEKV